MLRSTTASIGQQARKGGEHGRSNPKPVVPAKGPEILPTDQIARARRNLRLFEA